MRIVSLRRQLRYPIGWVAWMKGADRLIYAVVGTRGGGGGGGGKRWGTAHWVFHWRGALGVSVWRAAFVHVGSAYRRYMIRGVLAVVKGGFSGICRWTQDGGDSRLRGNDGRGAGTSLGVGRGDSRLRGNDVEGVGRT